MPRSGSLRDHVENSYGGGEIAMGSRFVALYKRSFDV